MNDALAIWQRVLAPDCTDLRRAAATADPTDVAAVSRLRRRWPAAEVATALSLAEARRRGVAKFGPRSQELVADLEGMQQASSLAAATHKARRFVDAGADTVLDLCCGIGGDAMGVRAAGLAVRAIDRDPVRAWMAGRNATCPSAAADAANLEEAGSFLHIDPSRRGDRGRVFRLTDYAPPPAALARLVRRSRGAAIKLGPGIDLDDLADRLPSGEVEFISEAGRLVQAVLWTGALARTRRSATRIDEGRIVTLPMDTEPPGGGITGTPPDRYLHTVDPAIERAGLVDRLARDTGLAVVHPKLGLLTGRKPVFSPWLTLFELIDQMPWRPQRVRQWLAAHDGGIVELKTRGVQLDPDRLQRRLRGPGDTAFTVFVLRFDRQVRALVACRRPGRPTGRH